MLHIKKVLGGRKCNKNMFARSGLCRICIHKAPKVTLSARNKHKGVSVSV